MALILKQKYPQADVIGLDLSPQMLTMADYKARQKELELTWYQGLAENSPFPSNYFDLISIALLFHETPRDITQAILQECFRLLVPGGQLLILDGNQSQLRQSEWLTQVFEEPYIQEFARGDLSHSLQEAGFEMVKTQVHWWINQI
ncbi:MAG: class I SAM-dependent methyltransferase, partial [Snowella sp.]